MKPVLLCILDGWGYSEAQGNNAIAEANTPNFDNLIANYPHALINTSGLDVGLPSGQMGNSEVGHMNIGSGRLIMQSLPLIDKSIADGELQKKPELRKLIEGLKQNGGTCHILGLLSDGGVHAHHDHIAALANIIADENIKVNIHAFTDGRDTPPASALNYIEQFNAKISNPNITISTVSGRYYAMDRDKRWDRVELAYDAMVSASGDSAYSAADAVKNSYNYGKNDEFIKPCVIGNYNGMQDGDALIMANFRSDRARQMLTALLDSAFSGFNRKKSVKFSSAVGMVEYSTELNNLLSTLFPPEKLTNILGEVVANKGLRQLRIAETEKYAHVTFFFNGGEEAEFPGEERILVPSPKVATYDLQPEMSANEVTDKIIAAVESGRFDLIVANYANTDMVGHTGIKSAAIKAVEAVDKCIGKLSDAINAAGGSMVITADHGNAEQMVDDLTGQPHTAHTTGPVPVVIYGRDCKNIKLKNGRLCDIAPTVLALMNIEKPVEMSGESLIDGK